MDYFIIAAVSFSGLYFHWWLYRRIRRWTERDLALSMAQGDADKREYMLACLQQARAQKVSRKALESWLQEAAERYEREHR
ncbi:30S ribosomal protein S3 [Halopseudomonas pachastrellae]|jgi:hypothetical protein|uniref:30S ribosomal protein S3 n=1 Tax=Halopseudomonas pachastrellae TaxID=254161 RepID=A0A1S8DGF5_9GAMM|nr:30S ribosomal protein S3 [Halopseudomonas pachastrellae]MED5492511.1 hypothetical protein [Pseudomonadota bacterium]ONM43886.1 30S ribosomal protein S3 [Halopseudomonas pachastrellae]SFM59737.1 hypothetical protein SAMN05216256_11582 [Halopseudomonas pachastrellae]